METSSRIFIKGLPPSITEVDFRKHFSSQSQDITEARLYPDRRIGFIGYKTIEDAQKAVKYFNKTFMRMSRIGVEIARPPGETQAPTARRDVVKATERLPRGGARSEKDKPENPQLKEFLEVMKAGQKKRAWDDNAIGDNTTPATNEALILPDEDDDEDYQSVPRKSKKAKVEQAEELSDAPQEEPDVNENSKDQGPVTDEDWTRSRTSRLLGLLDDDEEDGRDANATNGAVSQSPDDTVAEHPESVNAAEPNPEETPKTTSEVETIRETMRLFLRNLPYDLKEADLEVEFESFGHLEEVHIACSKQTGLGKGFAYLQFSDADAAEAAYHAKDGQIFQGRILHILPATAKREDKLNDFELSKLPLKKQQQIQRKRDASTFQFNWNTLYMNPDAVVSSVAAQLGIAKSEVLDPTSSDAAVKQAHAETHIIQETKSFFREHGVDLDAFKRSQRGDTAILVKNIPYDASRDELRRMFEEYGQIKKFLMPPSGVIAIVELSNAVQTKSAFSGLAYKRLKSSMLFLEKAPKDLFTANASIAGQQDSAQPGKSDTADLKSASDDLLVKDTPGVATLFVRNLNFDTSSAQLTETFSPLTGFLNARVKTRTDPKRPGQILSMGFGFVEFKTASEAQSALRTMDGYALHGHKLQVRASHKGTDATEERRKADQAKREAGHRTKVIIKNLPFEVSKKDVRALFSAYGQLRSIRVPKKMDRAARGFAFADFTTPKEAQSAMDALRDTHLLGRRLVLDYAEAEPADAEAEIEKMAAKVGSQTNAVAVQKLTGQGRKKFTTEQDEEDS